MEDLPKLSDETLEELRRYDMKSMALLDQHNAAHRDFVRRLEGYESLASPPETVGG